MEEYFQIKADRGIIRGMVHLPEKSEFVSATILIVHGYYSSNSVGPARLYVQLARHLCESGFTVFRADILGVGNSDGEFEEITYERMIADTEIIVAYIKKKTKTKPILIGHSIGSNIAILVYSRQPDMYLGAIVINPEIDFPPEGDRFFTVSQLSEMKESGFTIRKGLRINARFILRLREQPILEIARSIEGMVYLVQSENDEFYDPDGAKKLNSVLRNSKFIGIPEADHNFGKKECRKNLFLAVGQSALEIARANPG